MSERHRGSTRERERERDGKEWRGGKEFLVFLEASNATIHREQGPNKLSLTPTPLVCVLSV
jgi:hypothetical protein